MQRINTFSIQHNILAMNNIISQIIKRKQYYEQISIYYTYNTTL